MQSPRWYWHRLRSMSPPEIWWRVASVVQEKMDRVALPMRQRSLQAAWDDAAVDPVFDTAACLPPNLVGAGDSAAQDDIAGRPTFAGVIEQARKIQAHRITLFDLIDHDLGPRIDWNYEYAARRATPMDFAPSIDYRDHSLTGDAKLAWEPSRHYQLVVLGRAYRASGERSFAEEVVAQIESWIDQCPYGKGMQWRSPLELGIRLINWCWSLALIAPAGVLDAARKRRIEAVAARHLSDVARKYSRYSSANNHLVGEAAGVYVGASFFKSIAQAERLRDQAKAILQREMQRQVHDDGGHAELATGYHLFVLEFFLLAGLVGRWIGDAFDAAYWQKMESMFDFAAAMTEGGADMPLIGDADDGHVLDVCDRADRTRGLIAVGAGLFDRDDLGALAGDAHESAYWLLGAGAFDRTEKRARHENNLTSHALRDSGFYVLQNGVRSNSRSDDSMSLVFVCGPFGFESIAAHGHAHALSFILRIGGQDVLVDPGTYDYFRDLRWRDYFRSTRAHNTIAIDDADQSEMLGSFMWGHRADARCIRWEPDAHGGQVSGRHNGYERMGVTHTRSIVMRGNQGLIDVQDDLTGQGAHKATMYFHLAEYCTARLEKAGRVDVQFGKRQFSMTFDPAWSISTATGSEDPILGWVSRGYHRKIASTTIVATRRFEGKLLSNVRIGLHRSGES